MKILIVKFLSWLIAFFARKGGQTIKQAANNIILKDENFKEHAANEIKKIAAQSGVSKYYFKKAHRLPLASWI